MSTEASAAFIVKSWDEEPYDDIGDGARLARARVTQSYKGDIEGSSAVEYLLMHRADITADFVGLERLVGRVGGREGSVVLRHSGTFEGGTARSAWAFVPGSGTEGLAGLRGEGRFEAGPDGQSSVTFNYEFD